MSTRNKMSNLENKYQGGFRRVLCVCSAGMLRSPSVAWFLSNPPYNFNTRAAGLNSEYALVPVDEALIFWADDIIVMDSEYALVPVDEALIFWADDIIVMDSDMRDKINNMIENSKWKDDFEAPNIFVWGILDMFNYRDPELLRKIDVLAKKTYQDKKIIHDNIGDQICSRCDLCIT